MKIGFIKIALGILLVAAAIVGFSSQKKRPEGNAKAVYYFFPKANVYYDTTEKNYTYSDYQHNWHTRNQLPDSLAALLEVDKRVLLDHPPKPVWQNNEQDRIIYAVTLYATPADFKEKPAPTVIAPPQKPAATDNAPKKHESAIKKFFKRLFGKQKQGDSNSTTGFVKKHMANPLSAATSL